MRRSMALLAATPLTAALLAVGPSSAHATTLCPFVAGRPLTNRVLPDQNAQSSGAGTQASITSSSNWTAGDVVLAVVQWHDSPDALPPPPDPSWVQESQVLTAGGGWGTYSVALFEHLASGSENTVTFATDGAPWTIELQTFSGATMGWARQVFGSFEGAGSVTPQVVTHSNGATCYAGFTIAYFEDADSSGFVTATDYQGPSTIQDPSVLNPQVNDGWVTGGLTTAVLNDAGTYVPPRMDVNEGSSPDPIQQEVVWLEGQIGPSS